MAALLHRKPDHLGSAPLAEFQGWFGHSSRLGMQSAPVQLVQLFMSPEAPADGQSEKGDQKN
jgi:hypothetical protein